LVALVFSLITSLVVSVFSSTVFVNVPTVPLASSVVFTTGVLIVEDWSLTVFELLVLLQLEPENIKVLVPFFIV